jgi:aryl-alcohol dehydrogenase-like predicted oxidoreductase
MEYRRLGNSGIKVSVIGFGAWAIGGWMWGGTDQKDALDAVQEAIEAGITTIDTAPVYGFGLSEEIVGEAIKGKRSKVQILTKYGLRWDTQKGPHYFDTQDAQGRPIDLHRYAGKKDVIQECENSLRRLGTDYIDLYQIHWPDPTTPIEETMLAVEKLLQDGKVRAAGVCNYSVEQMELAEKVLVLSSGQIPYSMVNRGAEKELIPYCIKNNKGVIAYSPLQRGLLTGKIGMNHEFAPGDHRPSTPFFEPENCRKILSVLEKIRPLADAHGATLAQLAITWTIHMPGITVALVGARNPNQVKKNVKACDIGLSHDEIQRINELLEGLDLQP